MNVIPTRTNHPIRESAHTSPWLCYRPNAKCESRDRSSSIHMKENAIDKTLAIQMLVAKGSNKEIHTKPDLVRKEVKIISE